MRRAAFSVGLAAVVLHFALSANTISILGDEYAELTGDLLVRLHPATCLLSIAAGMALVLPRPGGSGLFNLFHEMPALAMAILLVVCCAGYAATNAGFAGASLYLEGPLSAGLLAVVLQGGTDRQRRALAWCVLGFCALSSIISLGEIGTETHLIPQQLTDGTPPQEENFYPAGLFGTPATAALTTSMAVFLLLHMRMNLLLKAVLFTTCLIGLLSFGGGIPLAATSALVLLTAVVLLVRGLARRTLRASVVATIGAATLLLPPLLLIVISATDLNLGLIERIYPASSVDDASALQWLVLHHLNLHDILFGVPLDRLETLTYQISLGQVPVAIANVWLLMFLQLGAIAFTVLLSAIGLLLLHLGRTAAQKLGWLLLAAAAVIDLTSGSPGRLGADWCFMTACMIAMTGYARNAPTLFLAPTVTNSLRRPVEHRNLEPISSRPPHAYLAGLKS